jgi:alcohol dehydrogenase class IV
MSATFSLPTEVLSGAGCLNDLPKALKRFDARNVLVVTDPGLVATGIPDRIAACLTAAGLSVSLYASVEPDPSIRTVEAVAEAVRSAGATALVGVGGGSSLDATKAGALLATHGRHLREYAGVDKVPAAVLPVVAVPTTAGTGSEVTVFAVISDPERDEKFTIASSHLAPRLAVLDPELTVKLPPAVTAMTGMDALTHAIEAASSRMAQPATDALATSAVRLIFTSLAGAVQNGESLIDRDNMLQAAFLAGAAFNSAYLGLCHALASPLGGHFHIPHGLANAIVLPFVMDFNVAVAADRYAALGIGAGISRRGEHPRVAAQRLIDAVRTLQHDIGTPIRLRDVGAKQDLLPSVAGDALKSIQLRFNPRPATKAQMLAVLQAAY